MRPVHFLTTALCCLTLPVIAETTDSDGDGVSDRDEARAGTNPLDPVSAFRITGIAKVDDPTGPLLRLTLPAVAGKSYQIPSSPDLQPTSWTAF